MNNNSQHISKFNSKGIKIVLTVLISLACFFCGTFFVLNSKKIETLTTSISNTNEIGKVDDNVKAANAASVEIGDNISYHETLNEAFSYANTNATTATITIYESQIVISTLTVNSGKIFMFKASTTGLSLTRNSAINFFNISNGGTLIIGENTSDNALTFIGNNKTASQISNSGMLIINNGIFCGGADASTMATTGPSKGGVISNTGTLTINGGIFKYNRTSNTGNGGVIYQEGSASTTIIGGEFGDKNKTSPAYSTGGAYDFVCSNYAQKGAVIYLADTSTLNISGGIYSFNYGSDGTVMYSTSTATPYSVIISGGTYQCNNGYDGAVLYLSSSAKANITDGLFGKTEIDGSPLGGSNKCSRGGVMFLTGTSQVVISGGTFSGNQSESAYSTGGGGAIWSDSNASVAIVISGGTFYNNTAGQSIGATINLYGSIANISGGTITDTRWNYPDIFLKASTGGYSSMLNIDGGTIGYIKVESGNINLSKNNDIDFEISNCINLSNGTNIMVTSAITNRIGRILVKADNHAVGDEIVKYVSTITSEQAVASTFALVTNGTNTIERTIKNNGTDDYYAIVLSESGKAAASVNGKTTSHLTVNDAFTFAKANATTGTIYVKISHEITGTITIASGESFTLKASAADLYLTRNSAINFFTIESGGTLIIGYSTSDKALSFIGNNKTASQISNAGTLTINNGIFCGGADASTMATNGPAEGGVVYNSNVLTINGGIYKNNRAKGQYSYMGNGGVIYQYGSASTTITGGIFGNDEILNGAATSNSCSNYAYSGGVIYSISTSSSALLVSGGLFSYNYANYGACIYASQNNEQNGIIISGGTFQNNGANTSSVLYTSNAKATITGGLFGKVEGITETATDINCSNYHVICLIGTSDLTITGGIFSYNYGYVITKAMAATVSVTITGGTFKYNGTNENGSVIDLMGNATVNMTGGTIENNNGMSNKSPIYLSRYESNTPTFNLCGGIINSFGENTENPCIYVNKGVLNLSKEDNTDFTLTGYINLASSGSYIGITNAITNSENRIKVKVAAPSIGYEVVKYDLNIINANIVASTFALYDTSGYLLSKQLIDAETDYYALVLQAPKMITINVDKNGSAYSNSTIQVALYYNGSVAYSAVACSSASSVTFNVDNLCVYNIYATRLESSPSTLVETGVTIDSSSASSATINYYSLTRTQGANTTLTIKWGSNSGTAISSSTSVLAGTIYVEATADAGYTLNLTKDSVSYTSGTTFTLSAATTIASSATADKFMVAYNSNKPSGASASIGGTEVTSSEATNASAYTVKSSTWTLMGWTFSTWNTKADGSGTNIAPGSVDAATVNSWYAETGVGKDGTKTLYAIWTADTYSIGYSGMTGATAGATQPDIGIYDTAFYVSAPTKTGYKFAGWMLSGDEADYTTAKWGVETNPAGAITNETKCINGTLGNVYFINLTAINEGRVVLIATWSINSYVVTYDSITNGGTTAQQTENVEYNGVVELEKIAEKEGWTFVGWNTDRDATEGLESLNMPTNDITLYAVYSKELTLNFYQVWATNPITKSVTIFNNKTSEEIEVPEVNEIENFNIVGWGESSTAKESSLASDAENTKVTLETEGSSYYAVYAYIVTISYNANGGNGDTISTNGIAYLTANKTINATKQADENNITLATNYFERKGHTFTKWAEGSVSGTQYGEGDLVTLTNNTEFFAIWNANKYSLNIVAYFNTLKDETDYVVGDKGGIVRLNNGELSDETNYMIEYGSRVTIKAVPKNNYQFAGWYNGNECICKDATFAFEMSDESIIYVAKFNEIATPLSILFPIVIGSSVLAVVGTITILSIILKRKRKRIRFKRAKLSDL